MYHSPDTLGYVFDFSNTKIKLLCKMFSNHTWNGGVVYTKLCILVCLQHLFWHGSERGLAGPYNPPGSATECIMP